MCAGAAALSITCETMRKVDRLPRSVTRSCDLCIHMRSLRASLFFWSSPLLGCPCLSPPRTHGRRQVLQPDVVALQEVRHANAKRPELNQAQELQLALDASVYPYLVYQRVSLHSNGLEEGLAILTKHRVVHWGYKVLIAHDAIATVFDTVSFFVDRVTATPDIDVQRLTMNGHMCVSCCVAKRCRLGDGRDHER
jgi:hypothetical protein